MEERLVQALITAEGISEENARTIVADMVDEGIDLAFVLDLYDRSLAGENLGADATTLAAIRNEVGTILTEIGGAEPRAQEVLRSEFDQFVQEEFGETTPAEQEALDEIFRQMFRDFRSTGRTDFDVFFDEQFDAITTDVQQGIAQGEATEAERALEQQRIAQATAAVENLRIPETLKAQIIADAVRQAEAEGLAGEVDEDRFNGIVDELVGGLLDASPTAALELEAEAAQEDPLALSQARRFDQNITDQELAATERETALGDPALTNQFNQFLNAQLAAGTSREALAGLQGTDLIGQFQAQQAAAEQARQATIGRRTSALQTATAAAGGQAQRRFGLGAVPEVGRPTLDPILSGVGPARAGDFGDFLTQNVGPLETQKAVDERAKLAERRRNRQTTRITAFG